MKRIARRVGISAALAVVAGTGLASAHITLETSRAPAGSTYKAVFRVPHGCDGSPTRTLHVQIPEGVVNVKPMPHAGWQIATRKGKLAKPYTSEGRTITEGVVEVEWSGGRLPDDQYDEFVLRGSLPKEPGQTLYFPVVQECERGANHWVAIPAAGKSADDYPEPAPGLLLTTPDSGGR
jgi:uncharacterized protein YcnI